jgi:transposase
VLTNPRGFEQDRQGISRRFTWIAKAGAPWRDLPERFGPWGTVWKRFDRWAKEGVWRRVFEELRDPDLEWIIIDSTVVRAHQHAAGAEKRG